MCPINSSLSKEIFLNVFLGLHDVEAIIALARYRFAGKKYIKFVDSENLFPIRFVSNKEAIKFFLQNRFLPKKLSQLGARALSPVEAIGVMSRTKGHVMLLIDSTPRLLSLSRATSFNQARLTQAALTFGIVYFDPIASK